MGFKDRVSEYLYLSDFTKSDIWKSETGQQYIEISPMQVFLVEQIAQNILDPIIEKCGKIFISAGVRNAKLMQLLLKHGYEPSPTTDHSYGDPLVNPVGSGAVDICPLSYETQNLFEWLCLESVAGRIPTNQVIYYPDMNFIHVSNPKSALFSPKIVAALNLNSKKPYCVKYKGKGYEVINPYDGFTPKPTTV